MHASPVRSPRRPWLRQRPREGQRGMVSLPEILVALGVLAAAVAIVTAIVVQANQVARNATVSMQTQSQLLDAMSRITRDVAFSSPVLSAPSNTEVWTQTMQGADCQRSRYWVGPDQTDANKSGLWAQKWTAANTNCADAGTPAANSPGDGPATEIVTGLTAPGTEVFTYYDINQVELAVPVADTMKINRVGVNLSAAVATRQNPLTLTTSVTPRDAYPDGSGPVAGARPMAPTGLLSAACVSGSTDLSWASVPGATGYTVLRDGVSQQPIVVGGAQTAWHQDGLVNGRGYQYQVLASSASGLSDLSNPVAVTCVPGTIALSGATVAADSDRLVNDNRLTWITPVNQDVEGYNLYRDGAPWKTVNGANALTATDPNVGWGQTHTYTVRAFNVAGEGADSNTVSLLIAPPAPALSGTATDDATDHLTWAAVASADCYRVYRDGSLVVGSQASPGYGDSGAGWGSSHTYQVAACSAAGEGPKSNPVTLNQRPSPFDIVGGSTSQWRKYNWCGGSPTTCHADSNQPGGASVTWTWSGGAYTYSVVMDGWDWFSVGNSNSSGFNGWPPGATVIYQIVAYAPNGLTRTSSPKTVLVPPTPPAHVHASTWCNKNVNSLGWKYGMDIFMGPETGYLDDVHILETRYAASAVNPDGTAAAWAYYDIARESWIPPTNAWSTYAWGGLPDPTGANVISNNRWEGGGMLVEGVKNGAADYGSPFSSRLGVDGAIKQATSPVMCARALNTGWGYNGNQAVQFNLDSMGPVTVTSGASSARLASQSNA